MLLQVPEVFPIQFRHRTVLSQYSSVQHLLELPEVFPIQFCHPPPEVFVLGFQRDEQPIRHGAGDTSGDTILYPSQCNVLCAVNSQGNKVKCAW